MRVRALLAVLPVAAFPLRAGAQAQSTHIDSSPVAAAYVAQAVRAQPNAPVLDGKLDEPVWKSAPVIGGFVQRNPKEGEPGTERTEAQVVYTDQALYIGVRAYDSDASKIVALLTRRDAGSSSDWIKVGIDSYRDRRTAFEFDVNPAGVKRDVYHYNDNDDDDSWDAVWDVAVSRDSEGWTAEFRIPFSQLRFSNQAQQVFGFEVVRVIARKNEEQYWKPIPKEASGLVSQFGDLAGIQDIRPPRRLEVLPYSVGSADMRAAEPGNPFQTGNAGRGSMGADVKYGVTSNLTVSATVNPDFGQVEADPAQVNLSAFESYFSERRPFFAEGMDIFQFPQNMFYTRRIGRSPQGSADPRGGHAEQVRQTHILGAAKLSGKTPKGWTIGLLTALTNRETAAVQDSLGRPFNDVVEPYTGYAVGRLAREWRSGKTRVGFFGTALRRDLTPNLQFLRREAYTGGFDWNYRFRKDTYQFYGWIAGTAVAGSRNAITRTQRSSARYFQRPDITEARLDTTRTSLEGFGGSIGFGKNGGGVWRFSTGIDTRSPGMEINDAGFQGSVDWHGQYFWMQRRWQKPGKVFRSVNINLNQWSNWTYAWDRTSLGGNVNWNWQFLNYWGGYMGGGPNAPSKSPDALRGGPLFIRPRTWNAWGGFYSDDRKPFQVSLNGWWFWQEAGASGRSQSGGIGPYLRWRPAANADLSVGPNWNWTADDWQYLRAATIAGTTEYFFGALRQTTTSMDFRANLTMKPTLSLQLYAQPFVSAGHYVEYKRVANPLAPRYDDRWDVFASDRLVLNGDNVSVDLNRDGVAEVNLGNPNFTVLSFLSNAVLRYEYRPGSTIFLVWQHGRNGFNNNGQYSFSRDFGDLFQAQSENTLLLKVNYWLSP